MKKKKGGERERERERERANNEQCHPILLIIIAHPLVRCGNLRIVKLLLQHGASIDSVNAQV